MADLITKFAKRIVLLWDFDFTKVTPKERDLIKHAEDSGYIPEDEIDWEHLEKYAE